MIGIEGEVEGWTRGSQKKFRRNFARLLAVSALVAAAACGDSSTAPKGPSPNDPAAGRFTLLTVNAKPLPFTIFSQSGYKLDFSASTLALTTDGKYVMTQTTVETVAGFASTFQDTLTGTWRQNAGSITMTDSDGKTTTAATWDGRDVQLPLNAEGQTLQSVYRKGQ